MNDSKKKLHRRLVTGFISLTAALALFGFAALAGVHAQTNEAAEAGGKVISQQQAQESSFGFIAAALAFGLGALGAGIGVGNVGAAAMGAIAEKPEVAGQALIFVALAEGLMVFGFVIALMILGRV